MKQSGVLLFLNLLIRNQMFRRMFVSEKRVEFAYRVERSEQQMVQSHHIDISTLKLKS